MTEVAWRAKKKKKRKVSTSALTPSGSLSEVVLDKV
jgi:hypothetical protein